MDLEILLWTGTFLLGITIYILLFSPVLFWAYSIVSLKKIFCNGTGKTINPVFSW
jgi:hypothetical protein